MENRIFFQNFKRDKQYGYVEVIKIIDINRGRYANNGNLI